MLKISRKIFVFESKKKDVFFFSLLLLLSFIYVFWDLISDFNSYIISYIEDDGVTIFLDLRRYLKQYLEVGKVPLWYPLDYLGVPFFANQEAGVLHLPTLLSLYFFPLFAAFNFEILLMLFLGGLFFFVWARYEHKRSFVASLLGSFVFTFMGQHISYLYEGGLSNLNTIAWIPLCFFTFERLSRTRKVIDICYTSGVLFMLVVSGHGEFTYYTCLILFFWGIYNIIKLKNNERKRLFLVYSATLILSVLLSCAQLSSMASMILESSRGGGVKFDLDWIDQLYLKSFLSLISYGILGPKHIVNYGQSLFLGVTGFFLLILSLKLFFYKRVRVYFIIFVTLLIVSMGTNTIFPFLVIRKAIFGMDFFRNPIFCAFMAFTFLSLLLSYSLDLMVKPKMLKYSSLFFLLIGFIFLFFSYYFTSNIIPIYIDNTIFSPSTLFLKESSFFSILLGILLAIAVRFNLSRKYIKWTMSFVFISELVYNAPKAIHLSHKNDIAPKGFNDQVRSKLGPYSRIYIVKGCWGENFDKVMGLHLPSERFASYVSYGVYKNFRKSDESSYMHIASLPPKHLKYMRYSGYCFKEESLHRADIMADNKSYQRFHLYSSWDVIDSRQKILSTIFSEDFNLFENVVIAEKTNLIQGQTGIKHEYQVKYLGGNNDKYRVKISTNKNAILLITDSYFKGWHVKNLKADSRKYQVIPGQYIYQAIPLEEGTHDIEIYYRPQFFYQSIAISCFVLILLLCYILNNLWRKYDTQKKTIN